MVKFLIIRLSSIGDIVLTTPVVRCLKEQLEDAEIHYLVKKQYISVIENNPYISKIHVFDGDLKKTIRDLKYEFFDHIIDLHNNLRTARIKNALPFYSVSFNKLNREKWLMTNLKINRLPNVHIVDRYMETVRFFDVENDGKGLDYFISASDEVLPESFGLEKNQKFILFAIGAQHATKRLPANKIAEICRLIPSPTLLAGGPEDFETGERIRNDVGENVINTCGKLKLNQSASLVKQADVVITHDTGLMHIAAAYKKKIVSVWGNTIPLFGMSPYLPGSGSRIIELENLKCRPCSKIGYDKCPKKHFRCMNDININEIVSAVMENE